MIANIIFSLQKEYILKFKFVNFIKKIYELEQECFENFYSLEVIQECFHSKNYDFIFLYLQNNNKLVYVVNALENKILYSDIPNNKNNLDHKNENLIGYAIIIEYQDFIELLRFGVKNKYQNQGFGKFLLKLIIEYYFFYKNFNKIYLETAENNDKAIHLYQSYGFKTYLVRKRYYNHLYNAHCMMLDKENYNLNQNK